MPARCHPGRCGTPRPPFPKLRLGRPLALGLAGGQRGGLRRRSRRLTPLGHVGDDGVAALRERLDQLPVDAVDVGVTVADLLPRDPQPGRELVAQLGLVEDPGGLGVGAQLPRIERPPHAIVGGAGEVGDQHVGVQQRIVRREIRCRNAAATNPSTGSVSTPPAPLRENPAEHCRSPIAASTAASCDATTSAAVSRSPRAHSSDTDFGARKV